MPFCVFEDTATTECAVVMDHEVTTSDLMALAAATTGLICASSVERLSGLRSEVMVVYKTPTIVRLRPEAAGPLMLHLPQYR